MASRQFNFVEKCDAGDAVVMEGDLADRLDNWQRGESQTAPHCVKAFLDAMTKQRPSRGASGHHLSGEQLDALADGALSAVEGDEEQLFLVGRLHAMDKFPLLFIQAISRAGDALQKDERKFRQQLDDVLEKGSLPMAALQYIQARRRQHVVDALKDMRGKMASWGYPQKASADLWIWHFDEEHEHRHALQKHFDKEHERLLWYEDASKYSSYFF